MEMIDFVIQLLCILVSSCTVRINGIQDRESLEQSKVAKSAHCGGVFNAVPGSIRHPDSSERYGSNELCMWSIGTDVPLFFYFSKFNTETQFDYVTARDGGTIGSPEIGIYSGKSLTEVPQTFATTGAALITFNSDENVVGQGFILNWRVYSAEEQCKDDTGICLRTSDKCNGTITILENSCIDKCVCCKGQKAKEIITTLASIERSANFRNRSKSGLRNTHHLSTNRWMVMNIENKSPWDLKHPKAFTWYGFISSPPHITNSCTDSQFAARKRRNNATGTTGIVSYYINGMHVIVYWSVSYSGCNALGLGIYRDLGVHDPREGQKYNYFYDFYYYHGNYYEHAFNQAKTIAYRRVCYDHEGKDFCTSNRDVRVCGTMTTDAGAYIYVSIENDHSSHC